MGVGEVSADPAMDFTAENKLVIVDPQGEVVVDQDKYGCSAFNMYDFEVQTVDTPYGKLAGVVCCDLEYPYVVRQLSKKGVDILLVPSFEPSKGVVRAHAQMAPFRAIENGFSIFRTTIHGHSLAIDPYGRTLGAMNDTLVDEPVLVVQVPNRRIWTVYSAVGDLFGWLSACAFVAIVVLAVIRRRRAKRA
jgi:apolipoprotein N-acyltransferase